MTAALRVARRLLQWKITPRGVAFTIILCVFCTTIVVRHLGWFQFLEFQAYDFLIRHQTKAASSEPIVLVEMTEADIHSPDLDYPIYDDKLGELLSILAADQPAVIGLDIWRDVPVPKNGKRLHVFTDVLEAHSNIVAIFTLGGKGIKPPAVLNSNPDRVAFNDNFPVDIEVDRTVPKVRRCVLFANSGGQEFDSLPFHLAVMYLQRKGIVPAPDPTDPSGMRLGEAQLRPFQSNDGAYVGADATGCQVLLDFKCPDQFTRFTVTEALSGKIPPGTLRDKVVLVGINTASVSDERVTPIRGDHRGIEVQAMTVHQILRQALNGEKSLRVWPDWMEDLWILLWCLAGGGIAYGLRSPWRLFSVTVVFLLVLAGGAWTAFKLGWWIPVVVPAASFAPAVALVISYISFHEKKQRGQLMQLFSRQVSPDIAQALWDQREEFLAGQRPRSQKLTATVLFTDLVGFSSTSEKMDPGRLMDWLNEYMEAMATEIMAHQGVVEKYIGDAIMAVFGVPLARTTADEISVDAHNAVCCALAMRKRLVDLNVGWKERGLPVCGMRIGIHTGPLVAGSLGSAERQEYTVIGDSVNIASRLESFDKDLGKSDVPGGCRILISEASYLLLRGDFPTTRVGTMNLKNKVEPVIIYAVH